MIRKVGDIMSSIREGYIELGVDNFYKLHSNDYQNPHKIIIQKLLLYAKENWNLGENILDLCCGSGEVSEIFLDRNIVGCDTYTYTLYENKTKNKCYNKTFQDIVSNGLENNYDTIVCSFALHLCPESMLPILLYQLSLKCNKLIILTPHKRPNCNNIYGWKLKEKIKEDKVSMCLYEL